MENMINKDIKRINLEFTKEEIMALNKAKDMPIIFDQDCPETTPERARKFKRVNPPRKIVVQ